MRYTITICYLLITGVALGQTYPYALKTIAGANPTGDGGPATAALLDQPQAVALDPSGQLYIAQGNIGGIRKVDKNGAISTYSTMYAADLKFDSAGNLYFSDGYATVYKIAPGGQASTFAGGSYGFGGDGGPAASARLESPQGLAVDSTGNVYIADSENCRIRKVTTDGKIQTVAGNGKCSQVFTNAGVNVSNGTQATTAPLYLPEAVAVDASGNLFIADSFVIEKVTPNGFINQIAGYPSSGLTNGPALGAYISDMVGLSTDSLGNLYVADQNVSLVRVISPAGQITTIAGSLNLGESVFAFAGDGGPATLADLFFPSSVAVDSNNFLYIADQGNARIRKLDQAHVVISTVAGASHFGGDGGPAANALMYIPYDVTFDAAGNLYFADYSNHRVRKISSSGVISTVAGNGTCAYSGDGGPAAAASLCFPTSARFDPSGNLLIADSFNFVIRKVNVSGLIGTFAGNGQDADKGDGGLASAASFEDPFGLAVDSSGNVYVSDNYANRVRKITPSGAISTVAGTGISGSTGDGALATSAKLNSPSLLALDSANNLYIADQGNNRVRKVSAGVISTVAGVQTCCAANGKAAGTYIGTPEGMTFDPAGNLFITSSTFNAIFAVAPDGSISAPGGNGSGGFSGDGLAASNSLDGPTGIVADKSGNLYFTDRYNNRIRALLPDAPSRLTISAGDQQTGAAGSQLPVPLTVQMSFQAGIPVPGIPVTFTVTSGQATLSATSTSTDATGLAGISVTLASAPGTAVITATAGMFSVTFHVTGTGPTSPAPTITAGGVQGAGGSTPAITTLSPGGFATAFGSTFAAAGTSRIVAASDFVNGALPTNLASTCVQVGGVNAFLSYVSDTQINFQVPAIAPGPQTNVVVINGCGTASAVSSAPALVATAAATPEFLYWLRNANGQDPVVAVNSVTYAYVGAVGLIPGVTFTPAKPGDYLTIYAISFGPTNPAVAPGVGATGAASTTNPATVTLGTSALPAANVLYVGASPGTAGLYQVNIQVPALPDGNYPISVSLGPYNTPAGGFLSVKN